MRAKAEAAPQAVCFAENHRQRGRMPLLVCERDCAKVHRPALERSTRCASRAPPAVRSVACPRHDCLYAVPHFAIGAWLPSPLTWERLSSDTSAKSLGTRIGVSTMRARDVTSEERNCASKC